MIGLLREYENWLISEELAAGTNSEAVFAIFHGYKLYMTNLVRSYGAKYRTATRYRCFSNEYTLLSTFTFQVYVKSRPRDVHHAKACPTNFSETSQSFSASLLDTARGCALPLI